jgi:large conductance mechanosensitive channel
MKLTTPFRSFLDFIRERGVMGLAVGVLMGTAVSRLVTALVNDILNPLIGLLLPGDDELTKKAFSVAGATIAWGDFIKVTIDFLVVILVIYLGFSLLKLGHHHEKEKEES